MNYYVKQFFLRGMMFGGFGPIVAGIVYLILSFTLPDFSLSGTEVFLAILSTYLLAFLQAGASIFNQIEHWPIAKSLFFHFTTLFLAYSLCYILNRWIPFEWTILLLFAGIFTVTYFVIWLSVYFSVRAFTKRVNRILKS